MKSKHITLHRLTRLAAGALATLVLVACGSGGSGTFNNPPAPGTYAGGVSNNGANAHRFVIRDGGSYWILLGSATNNRFEQTGFVVGSNIYSKDYASGTLFYANNSVGVLVNMNTSQSGVATTVAGNIQFTDTGANSTFTGQNYSLNGLTIEGNWDAISEARLAVVLRVDSQGVLNGLTNVNDPINECAFQGTLDATVLRGFYDATISDRLGCLGPRFTTYAGIAVTETAWAPYNQQLMIAAVGNGRGISLSGVR